VDEIGLLDIVKLILHAFASTMKCWIISKARANLAKLILLRSEKSKQQVRKASHCGSN